MSLTQDRRAWLVGGVLAALVLLLAGWFLLISPTFASTSSLKSQTSDVQLQNAVLGSKVSKLKTENDQIDSLRSQLAAAVSGLPTDSGLSDFGRQVSGQAALAGVGVTGVTVGGVQPFTSGLSSAGAAAPAAGGLYSISVTVNTVGPAKKQFEFLRLLQHVGPRRALVTSTTFAPGAGSQVASIDGSSALTTVMTLFSSPVTPEQETQLQKLLSPAGS